MGPGALLRPYDPDAKVNVSLERLRSVPMRLSGLGKTGGCGHETRTEIVRDAGQRSYGVGTRPEDDERCLSSALVCARRGGHELWLALSYIEMNIVSDIVSDPSGRSTGISGFGDLRQLAAACGKIEMTR
jgi:hypothetical protein